MTSKREEIARRLKRIEDIRALPKRYVLLEITFDGTSRSPLHKWDWTTMLDVTEARPIAISQAGGLTDIVDALNHE